MGFDAREESINSIFTGNTYIYKIPRYQRKYVWEQRNWKQLIDDIEYSADNNFEWTHFIGSIVLEERNNENSNTVKDRTIIDGQQRLTTVQIFIFGCIYYFQSYLENNVNVSEDNKNKIKSHIEALRDLIKTRIPGKTTESKLVFDGDMNFKFLSQNSLEDEGFNDLKKVLTIKKKSPILKAYEYIVNHLQKYLDNLEYVIKFEEAMINIRVVVISAKQSEEAYNIFEILNARGTQLKQFELMKNYIFRYIQPKEMLDQCKIEWDEMEKNLIDIDADDFLFHFTRAKYYKNPLKQEDLYYFVKLKHKDSRDIVNAVKEYYEEMKLASIEYKKIVNCEDMPDDIHNIIYYFKIKQIKQIRAVLLALNLKLNANKISSRLYKELLVMLRNFYVMFNIRSLTSNKIDNVIHKLANNIYVSHNEYDIELCVRKFILDNKSYFNFDENVRYFNTIDYTNKTIASSTSKFIIYLFEHLLRNEYDMTPFDYTKLTVEHIVNDSNELMYTHHLGNLIPLEKNLNEECDNLSYSEKRTLYGKSSYEYVRNLANNNDSFDLTIINNRTEELAQDFSNYFSIDIAANETRVFELKEQKEIIENFNVYDKELSEFKFLAFKKPQAIMHYLNNNQLPEKEKNIILKIISHKLS